MIAALAVCVSACSPSSKIKYDGYYCRLSSDGTYHYVLRFYESGDVISASVQFEDNEPKELSWFDISDSSVANGRWKQEGKEVAFSCMSEAGRVDYTGKMKSDRMILDSESQINGFRNYAQEYIFIPFSEMD